MNNPFSEKNPHPNITGIVQRQLDAYNARDIDAFAATYHDNLDLYIFPNDLICQGKTQLREQYSKRFSDRPDAKASIVSRVVIGPYVIDDEIVTGIPEIGTLRALAMYEVKDGLIAKVWFIYEPQILQN